MTLLLVGLTLFGGQLMADETTGDGQEPEIPEFHGSPQHVFEIDAVNLSDENGPEDEPEDEIAE